MIPKKIHYCWLSGEEMPPLLKKCMKTWEKHLNDYEFICWDSNKFDIHLNSFVEEAFHARKWAFAADYIRLYALYNEGGIYLDLDVVIKKNFNIFLKWDFFTSVEFHPAIVKRENSFDLLNPDGSKKNPKSTITGIGIQAAVMGSIPGHPFLKKCMDFYEDKHFILEDGNFFNKIIAPDIYAEVAEQYGFMYKDTKQILSDNMLILPSNVILGSATYKQKNSFAIHLNNGSWREKGVKNIFFRVKDKLSSYFKIERL
jgi:mannosyltransferase OCH1-like enzyme